MECLAVISQPKSIGVSRDPGSRSHVVESAASAVPILSPKSIPSQNLSTSLELVEQRVPSVLAPSVNLLSPSNPTPSETLVG